VIPGHPGDLRLLADPADFRDVGLDDVEGPRGEKRQERLPARENLAAGNRHWRVFPEEDEVVERIGPQRFPGPKPGCGYIQT
jgi:hypothetical protein